MVGYQGLVQWQEHSTRCTGLTVPTELCAAQVLLIFRLPTKFGDYPTPLAYVRWFRRFSAKDQTIGMYKIAPSTRSGGYPNNSIIPITHIVRSCHLVPTFGKEIDHSWTHENVLKKASDFFLNPYLRYLDFFLLRYLDSDVTEDSMAVGSQGG